MKQRNNLNSQATHKRNTQMIRVRKHIKMKFTSKLQQIEKIVSNVFFYQIVFDLNVNRKQNMNECRR